MKKILILTLSALAMNLFALDITGAWALEDNVTLNEDLHIYSGGSVYPTNGHWTLTVNGNIINDGTIRNEGGAGSNQLFVVCSGNFTNLGSVTNASFTMNSSSPKYISTPSGSAPIESYYFNIENGNTLIAQSILYFKNNNVIFTSGGALDISEPYGINLDNSYFDGGDIDGKTGDVPQSFINIENGGYINNSTCTNVKLTGTFLIADNVVIAGNSGNDAVIKSWSNAHRTLTTRGNFINYSSGIITDNPPYQTYVDSYDYFENNGTVENSTVNFYGEFSNNLPFFTPYSLNFSGTSAVQNVSTAWGCPIRATYTNCTNPYGILAKTDLEFLASYINFTDYQIDLTENRTLYVDGGYINRTYIKGIGASKASLSYLNMSNGSYIQNSVIENLILNGTTNVCDVMNLNGKVVNTGTLQNIDWFSYTLTINGDFDNLGTVTDNPSGYDLYVDFKGSNLYNGGIWTNEMTSFTGSSVQNLSNAVGTPFVSHYVTVDNSYGILAKSDLEFSNSYINFTDNNLDLTEGYHAYFSGGYINRMNVIGARPATKTASYFNMANGCYIQNSTLSDVTLSGTTDISEGMFLGGKVINTGIIQNKDWWGYTLTVNGDFDNLGFIQNNTTGYNLTVDFKGDNLYNAGTWTGENLIFSGTNPQNLSCAFAHAIQTRYLNCSNTNGITAASDLFFNSCEISLSDYTLDLSSGFDADVNGGVIYNSVISGDPAETYLYLSNSAKIYDSTIRDVMLNGWTNIDADVVFEGDILNTGYLQNIPDYFSNLEINGNFRNTGFVYDNTEGWYLNIDAKGNISNHGTWTNNKLDLNGDSHQHVTIGFGYQISCPELYITTNIVNGPYEWRYNKTPIQESNPDFENETIQNLRWLVPIDLSYSGTFYCETGDGASKCVYINDGIFEVPNITSMTNDGSNVSITWDAIPSAVYYRVFSSDDPYKDHNDSSWFCEDENVTTNSWSAPVPAGNKKFYFVTAVY